jgi:3-methyladenine DNA glycosylase AlkC
LRPSDVPRQIVDALNRGERESRNLAEWLAVDFNRLFRHVRVELSHNGYTVDRVVRFSGGILSRLAGVGAFFRESDPDRRQHLHEFLAGHRSDIVRQWAAYMLFADAELPLKERISRTTRFAADSNMSVREVAWMTLRPYLARELGQGLKLVVPWVESSDPNVRRCAIEVTRPRSVWGAHISELKRSPELGLHLLESVRNDQHRYVQTAVANWLNDASKSRPDWVILLTDRWLSESESPRVRWVVRRARRTLLRSGLPN